MTQEADPRSKRITILLEALTTISYLKGGDGKAAAIAEYALDQYGKSIRNADASDRRRSTYVSPLGIQDRRSGEERRNRSGVQKGFSEWVTVAQLFLGCRADQRKMKSRRKNARRHAENGPPAGLDERRLNADRRVVADRRGNPCLDAAR